jgi:hypothetical protein
MDNREQKAKTAECIVLLMYAVFLCISFLQATQFVAADETQSLLKIGRYFVVAGLVISFLYTEDLDTNKIVYVLIVIGLSIFIGFKNQDHTSTLLVGLFIAAGINLKSKRFLDVYCMVSAAVMIFTILMLICGAYTNDFLTETARSIRYYLGYDYTTTLPNIFLHFLLAWFAARENRINIFSTIVILAVNQILMKYTGTRAVYLLVILLLICLWLNKLKFPLFRYKWIGKLSVLLTPLLCIFSFASVLLYSEGNTYLVKLNTILSGRLSYSQTAVKKFGIGLFGEIVNFNTGRESIDRVGEYLFVDSSYIYDAMIFGIIALAIIVLLFSILIYKSHQKGEYSLWICLLFISIHAFTDFQFMRLDYNPFLLMLGGMLFVQKNAELNECEKG